MIKHFIDIEDFTKKELDKILINAKKIKKNIKQYQFIFKNKTLGLLLQKESNRTRLSFTVGMQKLGGNVIDLNEKDIGFGKRESEKDILKTFSKYIDCLVVRNHDHKKMISYKSLNYLPIINGLSNHSHPCQILSDVFTIQEKLGKISILTICWIGDYNNVLRSLIQAQKLFLFKLNIVLPKQVIKKNNLIINNSNKSKISYTDNIIKGVINSDCIMTDVWVSMGEKNIKKKNLFKSYQVNNKIMQIAKKNAIFMHCLPAFREKEVTSEVLEGPQSVVWDQSENRMYVQQAILNYILGN